MKHITRLVQACTLLVTATSLPLSAQVSAQWDYSWDRNVDGFPGGSDNGGRWRNLDTSMTTQVTDNGPIGGGSSLNDYDWIQNNSFNLNATVGNFTYGSAQNLFLVITNNPAAPTTTDANWTALYLTSDGNYYAAAYQSAPTSSHVVNFFHSGTYSRTTVNTGDTSGGQDGTATKFSLNLSQTDLATLNIGTGAAGWEGFGYPFDNDGDTAGNASTPYRLGLWGRSYLTDAMSYGVTGNQLKWDIKDTGRIGTIDLVNDFNKGPTIVPEPSSTLLLGLGSIALLLRRRK